jgi:hypothetical protein
MNSGVALRLCILVSVLSAPAVTWAATGPRGCFWVHGRLSTYDGTPTLRIRPIGAKRLLGLCEAICGDTEEGPPLPANVKNAMPSSLPWSMWGEFQVCPLTKERPGHMRYVRLQSAKNLRATPRTTP